VKRGTFESVEFAMIHLPITSHAYLVRCVGLKGLLFPNSPLPLEYETHNSNKVVSKRNEATATFFIDSGAHMNVFFIMKAKILVLISELGHMGSQINNVD
jgi:hypothetical protein